MDDDLRLTLGEQTLSDSRLSKVRVQGARSYDLCAG